MESGALFSVAGGKVAAGLGHSATSGSVNFTLVAGALDERFGISDPDDGAGMCDRDVVPVVLALGRAAVLGDVFSR